MNHGVQTGLNLTPRTQARLDKLVWDSGRKPDDLVEDALVGYLDGVAHLREVLDTRYDDLKNGVVTAIDEDVALAHLWEHSRVRRSGWGGAPP
jgi:hypothetical protein